MDKDSILLTRLALAAMDDSERYRLALTHAFFAIGSMGGNTTDHALRPLWLELRAALEPKPKKGKD